MTAFKNISHIFTESKFRKYYDLGLINELVLRDLLIREDYRTIKKKTNQVIAINNLAEKYGLSYNAIHTIIFRKSRRKHIYFP